MNDQELANELLQLTLARHQGDADLEDRARLEYLLTSDDRARVLYAASIYDTVTLSDKAEANRVAGYGTHRTDGKKLDDVRETGAEESLEQDTPFSARLRFPASERRLNWPVSWKGGLVAACAAALAVIFAFPNQLDSLRGTLNDGTVSLNAPKAAQANDGESPPADPLAEESAEQGLPSFVARVVRVSPDVKWSEGADPYEFLLRVKVGQRLEIESGLVELEFYSGANIILHGPAVFTPMGPAAARLAMGRVTGNVEDGDFNLMTPAAEVIDLGTKFGVAVDKRSNTEVCVFSGKVSVQSAFSKTMRKPLLLTKGMAVRVAFDGRIDSSAQIDRNVFLRDMPVPRNFDRSPEILSLVDIISGGEGRQARMAGAINPLDGKWDQRPFPFTELAMAKIGPSSGQAMAKLTFIGNEQYRACSDSTVIDGVFIPSAHGKGVVINSAGDAIDLPPNEGATWGPIWARRHTSGISLVDDMEDFWGTDTLSGILQRLADAQYGIIGVHPNVGITLDLRSLRMLEGHSILSFESTLANLDNSEIRDPEYAKTHRCSIDFRVYVDGQLRYDRLDFSRSDGSSNVHVSLSDKDRFLTIVATDAGNTKKFDHLVLIDSVFRLEGM